MKKKEFIAGGVLYTTAVILIGIGIGMNSNDFRTLGVILLLITMILFGKKYQNLLKTLK